MCIPSRRLGIGVPVDPLRASIGQTVHTSEAEIQRADQRHSRKQSAPARHPLCERCDAAPQPAAGHIASFPNIHTAFKAEPYDVTDPNCGVG